MEAEEQEAPQPATVSRRTEADMLAARPAHLKRVRRSTDDAPAAPEGVRRCLRRSPGHVSGSPAAAAACPPASGAALRKRGRVDGCGSGSETESGDGLQEGGRCVKRRQMSMQQYT